MLSDAELHALVGHRVPGGTYAIAHWENFLLTDCTAREPMTADLVHPIALFHVPILGVGTSIAELFRLGGGDGQAGSVSLLGYDWEYLKPLREQRPYRIEGGVVSAERSIDASGTVQHDDIAFEIELVEPDGQLAARVTNRWRFVR